MDTTFTRITGLIIGTFLIAFFYGLLYTTMDFMKPGYNPAVSAQHAAQNVYGLFGNLTTEVKTDDSQKEEALVQPPLVHKIAHPYAVTADVSALLGGKLEKGTASFLRGAGKPQTEPVR